MLEHLFRFGKQKLLLDKFQTPDDRYEANWWLNIIWLSSCFLALQKSQGHFNLLKVQYQGRLKIFTRKTAICARETGVSGQ
jgi:hypothetical protein